MREQTTAARIIRANILPGFFIFIFAGIFIRPCKVSYLLLLIDIDIRSRPLNAYKTGERDIKGILKII